MGIKLDFIFGASRGSEGWLWLAITFGVFVVWLVEYVRAACAIASECVKGLGGPLEVADCGIADCGTAECGEFCATLGRACICWMCGAGGIEVFM